METSRTKSGTVTAMEGSGSQDKIIWFTANFYLAALSTAFLCLVWLLELLKILSLKLFGLRQCRDPISV